MVLFERLIHRSGDSACADQTLGAGKPDPLLPPRDSGLTIAPAETGEAR